jgi:replication factor C subunit 3/5
LTTINQLKKDKGLALADILTALSDELVKLEVPAKTRVVWIEGLSEIEWRLGGGGGETIQTGAVVGVVRKGAELMA